jgi:hypothetical protein
MPASEIRRPDLAKTVSKAVTQAPVWDFHTHLYTPAFGTPMGRGVDHDPRGLMLWGIDELLTYHYLIAEVLRECAGEALTPQRFYSLSKTEQADLIWRKLFVEATPLSEACRGVVTTLTRLGLDPSEATLEAYRKWFAEQSPDEQIDRVLEIAGVEKVTMTNDLFDNNERERWLANADPLRSDSRFPTVLRFDALVTEWEHAVPRLQAWGYEVDQQLSARAIDEVRRMLQEWIARLRPVYCAMSLPPTWRYPSTDEGARCLTEAILPACGEHGLPLALMIGVTRQINPAAKLAGDTVGAADVTSVANLCREFPHQRFLVTMLSRENQHELAVTARKFANLTPFGCWWFLNNPSLIDEITRMRLELLGPTFIPQHSDCRVLEQLIYKWDHSRRAIAAVLGDQYAKLADAGLTITDRMLQRDANRLLHGNVADLLQKEAV